MRVVKIFLNSSKLLFIGAAAGVGAGTGDKNTQKRTGSATLTTTMINRQYGTWLLTPRRSVSHLCPPPPLCCWKTYRK